MQPKIIEKEAAIQLGMSQRKLREWRQTGTIVGTKIGRSYFYDQKDLDHLWKFLKGKNTNLVLRKIQMMKKKSALASTREMYL